MPFDRKIPYRSTACAAVLVLLAAACSQGGGGGGGDFREADAKAAAQRWVSTEFTPSTLSRQQQLAEMDWFMKAAAPYRGMEINVVSETITTHEYESKQLAKAFTEITGIRLKHDLIQEGDVIEKLQTQIQGDQNIYDAYVNDSDLIGTHARGDYVVPLSDYIAGEGKAVTSPTLDLADFIGISFTTGPDKKIYQLPDQQFANLYWFRYDWFTDPDVKKQFKDAYGYELGVPVNWAAYEDIADFFTTKVNGNGTIDGKKVYGHMDYGSKDPSLGWRFTDSWLSMAGNGDPGLPNGLPVDDWGIRVENCRPVGSSVTRGGDTNGPASVYALTKYVDWLKRFAPKEAAGMNFSEAGPVPAQGNIAQQIFWYTSFTADMTTPGLPVVNARRHAEVAHRAEPARRVLEGRQQARLPGRRLVDAAEEHAEGAAGGGLAVRAVRHVEDGVAEEVDRRADVHPRLRHQERLLRANADKYGGLIEFYRGPAREQWTPTGTNVPDYPKLAQLWWQNVATAVTGETTPQQSMDNLAKQQDDILSRLERRGYGGACAPKLNPERDVQYWLDQPGAPAPKLADERGKPETLDYDRLIAQWKKAG